MGDIYETILIDRISEYQTKQRPLNVSQNVSQLSQNDISVFLVI